MIPVACIILAAGHSRRFGTRDKLMMPLGGIPLAAHILKNLPCEIFSETVVITSSEPVSGLCRSMGFDCARYEGGELSDSIRQGIGALRKPYEGILFVNADRPFLKPETIRRMTEAFRENPAAAVRLAWQGTPSNPVLFPVSFREKLLALTGDRGGSSLLKNAEIEVRYIEALEESEIIDIDDPDTLTKWNQCSRNTGKE